MYNGIYNMYSKMEKEEIIENWNKTIKQMEKAQQYLDRDEIDDALYFTWMASENLLNAIKVQVNGIHTTSHARKSRDAKRFYALGILSKDYSEVIRKLSELRLAAAFHPYTQIEKEYSKEDVEKFMEDIKSLMNETKNFLQTKNILK